MRFRSPASKKWLEKSPRALKGILLRFRINLLIEAFPKNSLGDFAFLFSDEVSKKHKIKKSDEVTDTSSEKSNIKSLKDSKENFL